jgi:hypothetical protein
MNLGESDCLKYPGIINESGKDFMSPAGHLHPVKIPVPPRSEFPQRSVPNFDRDSGSAIVRINVIAHHFAVKAINGKW